MVDLEDLNRQCDRQLETPHLRFMGQNTNHCPLPEAVVKAMHDSIERGELHAYAPPLGLEALRAAILADLGLETATALITDGGAVALYHICHTFLRSGDHFVTTEPGWKWPPLYARAIGASVTEIPIYDPAIGYRLSADALTEEMRMIYLVDPNNPLGTCIEEAEMKKIAAIARERDAIIIHDCTYRDFAEQHTLAARFYPEGTLTIYSFSKWLGIAGLRVGAVVGSAELIHRMAAVPPNSMGSNILSQRAALAGLREKNSWFPKIQNTQRRNQARIKETVEQIRGFHLPVYPSNGNYLTVECIEARIRPEELVEAMKKQRIIIRPGSYHTARAGDRFVKVSTTVPETWVDEFCELLPRLAEELRRPK